MVVIADREARTATDVDALFAEARRRRMHRRLAGAVVVLALAGLVIAGMTFGGGHHHLARTSRGDHRAVAAQHAAAHDALPPVRVAWIDELGQLQIANLATGAQHTGPVSDSSSSAPLVSAGGHLYWPDSGKNVAPIRDYDVATGRVMYLARGETVFASADGRHLYIVASSTRLIELRGDGSGQPTVLNVPAGWHVSGNLAIQWDGAVAGGIVVYSRLDSDYRKTMSTRDAIWSPATGKVRIIGTGERIEAAYTPAAARYSLLAWVPPGLFASDNPVLDIVNTSTLATVAVRSPLHHGFAMSGTPAFSPDGTRVALFSRTAPIGTGGWSVLAIASTRTGIVRLVRAASLFTTEDAFWADWLPTGHQLLVGAEGASYAVDTRTLHSRLFDFFASQLGFTAVVIPRES